MRTVRMDLDRQKCTQFFQTHIHEIAAFAWKAYRTHGRGLVRMRFAGVNGATQTQMDYVGAGEWRRNGERFVALGRHAEFKRVCDILQSYDIGKVAVMLLPDGSTCQLTPQYSLPQYFELMQSSQSLEFQVDGEQFWKIDGDGST